MSACENGPDPKTIWDLKRDPRTDAPRFYPPGEHPATWRMRAQLKKAEEIKAQGGTSRELDEFIDYLKTKIAEFEQAESDAKARYDWMLRDRRQEP